MRTRYVLAILVIPVVALLALGAVPSLLGGGETHYVVATEVSTDDGDPPGENATETVDGANLSERRFPYTTGALEADDGVSGGYEEGPFGFKESFAHTPFDEFGEFERWEYNATDGDVVYLERNGTYYRLEITDEPDDRRSERLERTERVAGPRVGH